MTGRSDGRNGRGGRRPGAGRPRAPGADDAILGATSAILRRSGLNGLSVEAVAAEAGVSVGSVYRRWPTKSALVAAAYLDVLGPVEPVDTGSLRGDLGELSETTYRYFTGDHGRILAALLARSGGEQELVQAIRDSAESRRAGLRRIIERAQKRGEVRADVDVELAIDVYVGPLWTRLLVTGRRITRPLVRRATAMTVAALSQ